MAKRKKHLNQDQKHLFESLNIMGNGEMIHDEAINSIKNMTPEQIKKVLEKFHEEVYELDEFSAGEKSWDDHFYRASARAHARQQTVLREIRNKLIEGGYDIYKLFE